MEPEGWMVITLLVLTSKVSSIAPGDESSLCLSDPRFRNGDYRSDQRILLDSYNYHCLIQPTFNEIACKWQVYVAGSTGTGWIAGGGGRCRSGARVCDFLNGRDHDNWLFTQYVSYLDSREVFVNISYNFVECRQNPLCNALSVKVFQYSTNNQNSQERVNPLNYNLIGQIEQRSSENDSNVLLHFDRVTGVNGFYLGFQDTGSCGTINRVQIFYKACPSIVVRLVSYPSLALPPQASSNPNVGHAICASNSVQSTDLEFRSYENGTCERPVSCECRQGYVESVKSMLHSILEFTQCEACPRGTYWSEIGPSCQPCPKNTDQSETGVVECRCSEGYYRAPQESSSSKCTSPPSGCQDIRVVSSRDTLLMVSWVRPETIGRDDYYYEVYYATITGSFVQHNRSPYVNCSQEVYYSVDGLTPLTTYTIRIVVNNGVSDQDIGNEHLRMCEVTGSTADGNLQAPINVTALCEVVTWEPPKTDSVTITGYDIRFGNGMTSSAIVVAKSADDRYHMIQEIGTLESEGNVTVQIRARSSSTAGIWSTELPLGCSPKCNCTAPNIGAPQQRTVLEILNGVIVWDAPHPSENVSHYQIQYQREGAAGNGVNMLSVEHPLQALLLGNLSIGQNYTVQVRAVNQIGVGNWSVPFSFEYDVFRPQQSLAIIRDPHSMSVKTGSDVKVSCTAIGDGPLTFIWGTTARITSLGLPTSVETVNSGGSVTSIISLLNVGSEHVGEYLCIVMNPRGSRIVSIPANISLERELVNAQVKFAKMSYNVSEGEGVISVEIIKEGTNENSFSVRVRADGESSSLQSFHEVLVFESDAHSVTVSVPITDDSVALEANEVLTLVLEVVSGRASVSDPDVIFVNILDDDILRLGFNTSNIMVSESEPPIQICITKSHVTAIPVTVNVVQRPQTATPGQDYIESSIPRMITMEKNSTASCLVLTLVDDTDPEPTEVLQLLIEDTNPLGVVVSSAVVSVSITDSDDDIGSLSIKLRLKDRVYLNHSVIPLNLVGEGDNALLCVTTNPNCCTGSNRFGDFYYPNGSKVGIANQQHGFYRNRGEQLIRLNQRPGAAPTTGIFQCEIVDDDGVVRFLSFSLVRDYVSFSQATYSVFEGDGAVEVCVEKSVPVQSSNPGVEVRVSGDLQQNTGQRLDQTLIFSPGGRQQCLTISLVDDAVALEETEVLTLSLQVSKDLVEVGDINCTKISVLDDDRLTMSLTKLSNVTEDSGSIDVCINFSNQFIRTFEISFTSPVQAITNAVTSTRNVDYVLPSLVIADLDSSDSGSVCSMLIIVDDDQSELLECTIITVTVSDDQVIIADNASSSELCIIDNDGPQVTFKQSRYMFLESDRQASVCLDKVGVTEEVVQVRVTGSDVGVNQVLTFLPNEAEKCVVLVLDDDQVALEEVQTITLTIDAIGNNVGIGANNFTVVGVLDNDELLLSLSKDSNVSEGDSGEICIEFSSSFARSFNIKVSTIIPANITVPYLATPDVDYTALPLSLMASAVTNNTKKLCHSFNAFDDGFVEPVECFVVSLVLPEEFMDMIRVVEDHRSVYCCIFDKLVIGFDQAEYSISEGAGELEVSVKVLQGQLTRPVTVEFSTMDGQALAPGDYGSMSRAIQFSPAVTNIMVKLLIVDDNVVEDPEDFSLTIITTDVDVELRPDRAAMTILDNDISSITISFENSEYQVTESDGQVEVCLVVVEDYFPPAPIEVTLTAKESSPEDATAEVDFAGSSKTVVFSVNSRSVCVSYDIVQDNVFESLEEHFLVTFSIIEGASLDVSKGEISEAAVWIMDDEGREVYFQLNGVRIDYNNRVTVNINDIGEGDNALLCTTDNRVCCGVPPNRFGEWYYPNEAIVRPAFAQQDFYRNRGDRIVRLNRRNNARSPVGRYHCEIPNVSGTMQSIYINIVNE